jgi:hypothetical protein
MRYHRKTLRERLKLSKPESARRTWKRDKLKRLKKRRLSQGDARRRRTNASLPRLASLPWLAA